MGKDGGRKINTKSSENLRERERGGRVQKKKERAGKKTWAKLKI